ncbi:MAG: hypothetical protein QOG62_836 [Thermoleophilaceae bacterium]|nr:hypothetical protein [Thermoleophilaceae bacterium]
MEAVGEQRLRLAGFETRVLELEGTGPPLILIHGFSDSADTWRPALERLAQLGRRAVAVDLPGFGEADRLDPGPILPQYDRFARALVRKYAPEGGAIVAGNSLGGLVSMRLAENPDFDLAGIIPVAPAGLDMARWVTVVERDMVLRTLLAAPVPLPGIAVRAVVAEVYRRFAFHRPSRIDPRVSLSFTRHLNSRDTVAETLALARRMVPELRHPFNLSRIHCPVLMVWGANDLLVFPTGAERVLEVVPDSRLVTFEHCGHCPQIEEADRFVELLVEFPHQFAKAA